MTSPAMQNDLNQACESPMMLSLVVNGQPFDVPAVATLATLIEMRKPRPPFAVELNKQLVHRTLYGTTRLHAGDTVEIVTLVGGG